MGSKNLKAVVVQGSKKGVRIAQPERLKELITYYRQLGRIPLALQPSRSTTHADPMLNDRPVPGPPLKNDPCYGCLGTCPRVLYQTPDGKKGKFMCDSGMFYQPWAEKYYGDWNDVPFHANRLVDNYGLDSVAINLMIGWLHQCWEAGILTDENTGLPLSQAGSLEFIETLVRKISLRDGFGGILAQGIQKAADLVGPEAKEQLKTAGYFFKPGNNDLYGPRLFITTGLFYAMEPRVPIGQLHQVSHIHSKWLVWLHGFPAWDISTDAIRAIAKRFWGSELAADFSTYEGKALAAKMIQDRDCAKESLILCDWLFPIMELPHTENHVGDPTLESKILSAVTGNETDEEGLYRIGERIFNLQRAILVREGHRERNFDDVPEHCYSQPLEWYYFNHECLVPGKDGEVTSRKGAVVERDKFENMKDEYYQLRRWDVATGLQTRATLEELGLTQVAQDLGNRGLLP